MSDIFTRIAAQIEEECAFPLHFDEDGAAIILRQAFGWRPIDDRAKNGEPWLVCVAGADFHADKAHWNGREWVLSCGRHRLTVPPTHYKPLDEPPS